MIVSFLFLLLFSITVYIPFLSYFFVPVHMLYKSYFGRQIMHSKTKIVVLHMKELIYTGIFVLLGILFIVLLVMMFVPDKKQTQETTTTSYIPGVYTTSLALGQNSLEIEIVLDAEHINSIRLVNLSEAVTTMYPLIEPSFDTLVSQIYAGQPLDQITFSDENRYTSSVLLGAITQTLQKAVPTADEQPES